MEEYMTMSTAIGGNVGTATAGRITCILLTGLLCAAPLTAQETQPLAWQQNRNVAGSLSDFLVAANLVSDSIDSLNHNDWRRAFGCQALRTGLVLGVTELTKLAVHRTRPDGSDRNSFPSEHSALSAVSSGWKWQVGVPFAFGAGYFRMAADKHYATDVAVGLAGGFLARKVCSK